MDLEEANFRYRVLEAACNPKKLDALEAQIREKVSPREGAPNPPERIRVTATFYTGTLE